MVTKIFVMIGSAKEEQPKEPFDHDTSLTAGMINCGMRNSVAY